MWIRCRFCSDDKGRAWAGISPSGRPLRPDFRALLCTQPVSTIVATADGATATVSISYGISGLRSVSRFVVARSTMTAIENATRFCWKVRFRSTVTKRRTARPQAEVSAIPFPTFPAVRITDFDVGLPHAHSHPPNLIPPAPLVLLPSTGPVIPIPFVSGASTVVINGMPARRCGDMGMGIWCGGYFPMFEIFLGSSSIWIEGARVARIGGDITKHCTFSAPKPSDPPMGPMIGTTVSASPNVIIGACRCRRLPRWRSVRHSSWLSRESAKRSMPSGPLGPGAWRTNWFPCSARAKASPRDLRDQFWPERHVLCACEVHRMAGSAQQPLHPSRPVFLLDLDQRP